MEMPRFCFLRHSGLCSTVSSRSPLLLTCWLSGRVWRWQHWYTSARDAQWSLEFSLIHAPQLLPCSCVPPSRRYGFPMSARYPPEERIHWCTPRDQGRKPAVYVHQWQPIVETTQSHGRGLVGLCKAPSNASEITTRGSGEVCEQSQSSTSRLLVLPHP